MLAAITAREAFSGIRSLRARTRGGLVPRPCDVVRLRKPPLTGCPLGLAQTEPRASASGSPIAPNLAVMVLVADADALGPSRQRLHHSAAAQRHAGLCERIQEVKQQVVENLFGQRLFAR